MSVGGKDLVSWGVGKLGEKGLEVKLCRQLVPDVVFSCLHTTRIIIVVMIILIIRIIIIIIIIIIITIIMIHFTYLLSASRRLGIFIALYNTHIPPLTPPRPPHTHTHTNTHTHIYTDTHKHKHTHTHTH